MAGLIGVAIYFLPSLIAAARHTHNATGIFLLNLFLGWTGIGWLIALCLAICLHPLLLPPLLVLPSSAPPLVLAAFRVARKSGFDRDR